MEEKKKFIDKAGEKLKEILTRTDDQKDIDKSVRVVCKAARKLGKMKKDLIADGEIKEDEQSALDAYKQLVIDAVNNI